jgi:hypothetical protein
MVSCATKQVQPECHIVACHPGNALNEPWQLAVRARVVPHNVETVRDQVTFQYHSADLGRNDTGPPLSR